MIKHVRQLNRAVKSQTVPAQEDRLRGNLGSEAVSPDTQLAEPTVRLKIPGANKDRQKK